MNCALGVLKFAIPFLNDGHEVSTESYKLFCVIMRDAVSSTLTREQKWEASRLALHSAYKSDQHSPRAGDPQDIIAFLNHHFELVEQGEDHDEPIQDALCALAYASIPETIEALKNLDLTQPSFVRRICRMLQKCKPPRLHKAALFLLPLIADKWFNTPNPIMDDNEMKNLCVDWASAVEQIWDADAVREPVLAVLLDMINSPHWRPHVVPEKWKLLEYLALIPDDSQPLARCLKNPGLVDAISIMGNPDAMVIWSRVLLLRYNQLDPVVWK